MDGISDVQLLPRCLDIDPCVRILFQMLKYWSKSPDIGLGNLDIGKGVQTLLQVTRYPDIILGLWILVYVYGY